MSRVIERPSRVIRVSVTRETERRGRESVSPGRMYETGRRIKTVRTSSPVLNYRKRFDDKGIDRGPVIEGYETKVEEFEEPFEN